jgi:uncharacterized protein
MRVDPELVEILICPESRQPVVLASQGQIDAVNARIRAGTLRNRGGGAVEKELEEGLIRQDGRVLYPVDDGIPVMLVEESIEL